MNSKNLFDVLGSHSNDRVMGRYTFAAPSLQCVERLLDAESLRQGMIEENLTGVAVYSEEWGQRTSGLKRNQGRRDGGTLALAQKRRHFCNGRCFEQCR